MYNDVSPPLGTRTSRLSASSSTKETAENPEKLPLTDEEKKLQEDKRNGPWKNNLMAGPKASQDLSKNSQKTPGVLETLRKMAEARLFKKNPDEVEPQKDPLESLGNLEPPAWDMDGDA
jgi:hypothetical protein